MKKGTNKDILHGFKPSEADADYLKQPEEKKALTKAALTKQWKSAAKEFDGATKMANLTVQAYIQVGHSLLALRGQYKGDKEFGQARQEHIQGMSTRWCSKLMAVARDPVLSQPTSAASISTLVELLPASEALKEKVLKAEEKPTVKAIREAVKEEKEPEEVLEGEIERRPARKVAEPVPSCDIAKTIAENLQYDIRPRCSVFYNRGKNKMNDEWCWFIMGLPPYFDDKYAPNKKSVEIIASSLLNLTLDITDDGDEEDRETVERAMERINEYYGS